MAEKKQAELPSGQIVKWTDREHPTVYANIMGLGMTPFDLSIIFGEIGDSTPTEVFGIPRVKVILSPEQVANLIKILTVGIQAYTKNNGLLRTGGAMNLDDFNKQLEANKVVAKK